MFSFIPGTFFVLVIFGNLIHRLCAGLTFYDTRDDRRDTAHTEGAMHAQIQVSVEASSEHSTRYNISFYKGTPPRLYKENGLS